MNIFTDEDIKEIVGPWGDTPIKGYTRSLFDKIEAKLREKRAEPQPDASSDYERGFIEGMQKQMQSSVDKAVNRMAALAEPQPEIEQLKAEREKVAQWMIQRSYATGHGDTTEDLLNELEWQVAERERKAILNILWDYAGRKDLSDSDESLLKHLVELIRARGES